MKSTSKFKWRLLSRIGLCLALSGSFAGRMRAAEWHAAVGAETSGRGGQALAFLPNEMWVRAGDSIRWTFPTHERHTLTFLSPGQTRPPGFGPIFGVPVGCPGITPTGSSFDGSACVTTGVFEDPNTPPYTVFFPMPGNFKFVCLVHADMTGVIHVTNGSEPLPHDQAFYDHEAEAQAAVLLADASRLQGAVTPTEEAGETDRVAAGSGQVVTTTGGGSQTASLMRFLRRVIVIRVGDTVEWTSLDPSITHTVTFGTEPADPRPPSSTSTPTSDGAQAGHDQLARG